MAIYVTSVKSGRTEALSLTKCKVVADYTVDELQDINELPTADKISGGSTAFVINTGQVFVLGKDGWREI